MQSPYGSTNIPMDKPSRTLSADQIKWAAAEFEQGMTIEQVGTSLGVKPGSLYNTLRRRGVKVTRTKGPNCKISDVRCFNDPFSSENAAYYIGFLMADGSVSQDEKSFSICIKESDRFVLDALNVFLGGRLAVSVKKREAGGTWNSSDLVNINFGNKELARDIISYGITRDKSQSGRFLRGVNHINHAWRGAIDGDGSVFLDSHGYPHIALCGNTHLLAQFQSYVRSLCPSWKGTVRKTHHKWLMQVTVNGRHAKILATALYDDCAIALPRKLENARKIIAWHPKRNRTD